MGTRRMSDANWLWFATIIFIILALAAILSGCAAPAISFAPTNPGPSSYQDDPLLDAAAKAWQARQK